MKGTLIHSVFMNRELLIYLPPSYNRHLEHFPVVYIQDEGDLFRDQLTALEQMSRRKELREVILIGIKPDNRNNEYTPWQARALKASNPDYGGQGADYLSFLVNSLKPYIDTTYRTLRSTEHTGIAGASFGGLISMYAAYLYPEVFGRIAVISGSFWYEGFIEFMQTTKLEVNGHRLYMDVGALEGLRKNSIQKNMVDKNKTAYDILLDKGFTVQDCRLLIEEGANHEQSSFLRRFPYALQWLFPAMPKQAPCN